MLNDFNRWLQDSVFKPLEDKKMPVMEHLVELQVRLTRAVIVTAIVFVVTFFYADALVKWLRIPLQNMFVPSTLSWEPTDLPTVPFVFLAPGEALWQNVKVAGLFAVVLDEAEAAQACDYIRGRGDRAEFMARFAHAMSPGFDPDRHLERIGCANQTTMLMTESLAIGEMFRQAVVDRYGSDQAAQRFRAFDTICSATQDRQDAVAELLDGHRLDLMLVVGGYNSSNTCNLAKMSASRVPTYHVADPACLQSTDAIRHKAVGEPVERTSLGWLPRSGPLAVGLTSGASTPDSVVERTIHRLAELTAGTAA